MAPAPREYELVLMLDPKQDAPKRDALAQEARGQIEASGTLKHENVWGLRKLAYEIGQCTEADYRWFRFEAPTDLLGSLDHSLKIADGVLRFRIFKVDPSAPVMVPPATPVAPPARDRDDGEERRPAASAAPASAPAEVATAEAPPEAAPAEEAPAEDAPVEETPPEAAPPETAPQEGEGESAEAAE